MLLSFGIEPHRVSGFPRIMKARSIFNTWESIEAVKRRSSYQYDARYGRLAHLLTFVLTDLEA